MSPTLLDTHALLWYAEGALGRAAADRVVAASAANNLLLSPISAWEIGLLVRKGRLHLDRQLDDFVADAFHQAGFVTAFITPEIAAASANLSGPIHGDPADRILIASAIAYGATLMTRDARIRAYAKATKAFATLLC